ncbi:MAG: glycosyltransferase family 2 protein [Vicinamibacterales bacterium]
MKTLTVICPVYNEEEVIGFFYRELKAVLGTLASRYASTMLFVVDRGTDRTLDLLRDIAAQDQAVRVLALTARFGHQHALVAGMDHSDTDVVIMMDSDLQHPPEVLPQLLDAYETGYDIVYTYREDTNEIALIKRLTSRLFYRLLNAMSPMPISESAADFRLLSRRVVQVFQTQIRERNLFLRGLVGWVGFRSIGITFRVKQRRAGTSKYFVRRMVRFGIDGIVSFSKKPLQAATLVGLCFALFGGVVALATLVQYFYLSSLPSGWTTLTILIAVFSGIQLIFLGIIGEYIGAIFDEVKRRPHYLVEEAINFSSTDSAVLPASVRHATVR